MFVRKPLLLGCYSKVFWMKEEGEKVSMYSIASYIKTKPSFKYLKINSNQLIIY